MMQKAKLHTIAAQGRGELGTFLDRHMSSPTLGWPRRPMGLPRTSKVPRASGELGGLRALVVGELAMELTINVNGTRAAAWASLRHGRSGSELSWNIGELRVGGFAATASQAAGALGARVSICTIVPAPVPLRLEEFLDAHDPQWQFVKAVPGYSPVNFILRCVDGVLVVRRRGASSAGLFDLPHTRDNKFDAVLLDAAEPPFEQRVVHGNGHTSVAAAGIRVSDAWSNGRLPFAPQGRIWTFMRAVDARRLASNFGAGKSQKDDVSTAQQLQRRYGFGKLVTQLGSRGALLMNGHPSPQRVETCPVDPVCPTGAGAALLTVTTLSSAAGADDLTSLRRGVDAATGFCAGLEFPRCLQELDA